MNAERGNVIIRWNPADIRLGVTMDFYKKYELLEMFRDDGIKSFRAKEIATGRFVEVHLLIGSSPLNQALQRKVAELPPDRKRQVLDSGEHEGTFFIVTDPFPWNVTFKEWVTSAREAETQRPEAPVITPSVRGMWKVPPSQETASAQSETPASKTPQQPSPGSFTQQFQAAPVSGNIPESPPAPGSFTQQFQAVMQGNQGLGSGHPETPPPARTDPSSAGTPLEEDEPTFTQLFRIPAAPATKTVSSTPLPGSRTESEQPSFTGLFRTPTQPAAGELSERIPAPAEPVPPSFSQIFKTPAPHERQAEPVSPGAPDDDGPLTFTQMLEMSRPQEEKAVPTSPEPPAQPASPSFTQVFKTPERHEVKSEPALPSTPSAPAEPAPPSFTQMFKVPASQPTGSHPVAPPPAAPSFTQMFKVPQAEESKPAAASSQVPISGGEALTFTQMFKAPQPGSAPPAGSSRDAFPLPKPSATASPAQPAPAGEFTQMFQAPPPKPIGEPNVQPTPVPSPSSTGEFTNFFQSPMTAKPMKEAHLGVEPPRNLQPPPPPKQGPGEFTRIFGKGDVPPPPPGRSQQVFGQPPAHPALPFGQSSPFEQPAGPAAPFGQPSENPFAPTPQQQSGQGSTPINRSQAAYRPPASPLGGSNPRAYSDQPFSAPMSATGAFSAPQPSAPPMPAAPARSGPGEYTRVFATPTPSAPQPPPQAPVAPPAADLKAPSKLLPFLVLGGILLMTIIIVVVFAMMRK